MFTVADIMTSELYTLEPDASLLDARRLMAEHHVRHVPVVSEKNRLLGLVSQRDILAAADSTLIAAPGEEEQIEQLIAVSSVMTMDVMTTDEGAHLRGVGMQMQRHKIGCLLVLRGDILVGIITDSDFVSVAVNLMEQLEEVEPLDDELLDDVI